MKIIPFVHFANIGLTLLLIYRVISIDDDKGHLVFLFYFPLLILVNVAMWIISKMRKKNTQQVFLLSSICMSCLFIPIYLVLFLY